MSSFNNPFLMFLTRSNKNSPSQRQTNVAGLACGYQAAPRHDGAAHFSGPEAARSWLSLGDVERCFHDMIYWYLLYLYTYLYIEYFFPYDMIYLWFLVALQRPAFCFTSPRDAADPVVRLDPQALCNSTSPPLVTWLLPVYSITFVN